MKSVIFLSLFLYSFMAFSKTVVVSDIDDTIKKANSMGGIGGVYHFLKKKPYEAARDLFNEIKDHEGAEFFYVSAAPDFTFDGDEWIRKQKFPIGPVILKTRHNGGETYEYKYRTIKTILENELKADPALRVIFFGDNSQHDANVYYDLNREMGLNAIIYIRDVSTEATNFAANLPVVRLPGVNYFFSERELMEDDFFYFMSDELKMSILGSYRSKSLIPPYTLETLYERLRDICMKRSGVTENDPEPIKKACKLEAKVNSTLYWDEYHFRY